ncbi:50S ribosomal protein L23 [Candidatus Peregrinibacteria bacterium CG22_combo_CG10-13_8_21_14_all_44_10]|nr:MAG: 50S ribosomal protein L23 [Candidatus Peregrinibacteria bacterium CG2_30_44_17]PIP66052.1 MAG: 50S ribosomal protein L23 [Candidatus Peregrinibacteria bacterium CG22_combo_CG10-13_8_21_14_all_44_10]PIX78894.1 MAG: 50S ribosomal protein L23 [Candidatus Peregrinibacteria bacterium CG_4_10_14_3_um_filter_44_21]PJB88855.1 MAG: 50S ribosomal protein L23 [Candidatus Peregrinibacteria bacterium CG_4_9_14_0_8_um_filter_44_15]
MDFSQVIKKPVATEKSSRAEQSNKHTLVVNSKATKIDIKRAFKMLYGVDAIKVNSVRVPSKSRWGKGRKEMEKRPESKKVIVTLKAGQKFEFNKLKTVK